MLMGTNRERAASASRQTVTWAELLATALTPEEVLDITRDFIASWTPYEIAALPGPCKPPADGFRAPEDIVLYAYTLVSYHCGAGATDEGVSRMAKYFSHAAQQVALVMSNAPQPQAGNDEVPVKDGI
jgi:hypothetical protein